MSTTADPVAQGVSSPADSIVAQATTTVANAIAKTVAVISSTVSTSSTTGATPTSTPTSSTTFTSTPTSAATPTPTPIQSLSGGLKDEEEKLSVKDLSQALQHFGIVDYLVFIAMLAVCAVIGFYFGFIEKKQKKQKLADKDGGGAAGVEERRGSEALDYLVGGRQMKVFPVALSLVASFVSGISLLGTSTEIYVYGTQYAFILVTLAISGAISWYIFLPVFCNLQLTSTYEYFERRFDRRVRIFGSCLFVVMNILWQPICIYVPALTLNQVSGISVHTIVPLTSLICILYTSLGGIKGVVWTDVIQGFVMVGSMAIVIVKGTLDLGGLSVVLDHNRQFDRLVGPDLTFDPTARMGVFALFIGGALFKLQANGINQAIVQRYLTLPNNQAVKKALILSLVGLLMVMLMCVYIGMLAFAEFYHCDPITTGLARAKDQVIPLYVVKNIGHIPGLVGLFVAGVFSAALSSLSTALNALSGVILKDFVEPYRKKPLTERQTAYLLRGVVVSFGLISMASVPIVQRLGLVMQLSSTVAAITCGPLLGAFSVGMLLPFVKTESLLTGISIASSFTAYIVVRAQVAIFTGELTFPGKPVSVEDCDYSFDLPENWNATTTATPTESSSHGIHEISFLWYTAVGSVGTVLISLLATLYFGRQDPRVVDKELVSPVLRKFWYGKYESVASEEKVDLALHESETQPKLEQAEKS
ncbi:sodium-coupled monocarboxylate transporter 1 isoform X1 [Drosophila ficusphila]|uniref:sodium-coupled monocarboxylate transporter 1 isoform X1 n=1 Tax=Drosophila ficusphila TaxID=30025 RepID=UPI0007E83FDF|nr:sodium-coupled monocarboxylate transporter 1 isoform X1 [Drosophila ficusphila]XP_017052607.1 sodium-coupled monocarboxylate transporter 1 isoform X1 [Drosophila ficusphila]XP_017052608.1 sodium-coupled monocarboxylate transporter 1 isoform X1 [Drosophila ficusphila]